jgi:hypothetical protein
MKRMTTDEAGQQGDEGIYQLIVRFTRIPRYKDC